MNTDIVWSNLLNELKDELSSLAYDTWFNDTKLYIVKTKRQFEDIITTGKCYKNKYFVIYNKDNNLKYDRFGISVTKKLGNAVFRNRYKRIIRSIVDNYKKL